jgi:hypothetical protein
VHVMYCFQLALLKFQPFLFKSALLSDSLWLYLIWVLLRFLGACWCFLHQIRRIGVHFQNFRPVFLPFKIVFFIY